MSAWIKRNWVKLLPLAPLTLVLIATPQLFHARQKTAGEIIEEKSRKVHLLSVRDDLTIDEAWNRLYPVNRSVPKLRLDEKNRLKAMAERHRLETDNLIKATCERSPWIEYCR